MATGYYVDHAALTQAASTIHEASTTLNTTVANLMNHIESLMPTWKGLGATAFHGYMDQYHSDAQRMNAALASLGEAVTKANTGYLGQDQAAQQAFHTGA